MSSKSTSSLEAKVCVLGSAGVGKTSLVHRYVHGVFSPAATRSTLGASFVSKRALDPETGTIVRLQLWDTAGQERFRALSPIYYRGCAAVVLVYSILSARSFADMGAWLCEIRANVPSDVIIHVVGTKADVVAQDPARREVPFERCIAYVAENLHPAPAGGTNPGPSGRPASGRDDSKRASGLWAMDAGWDVCHEVSSSSGDGVEEVFRVITRKLVDQMQGVPSGGGRGDSGTAGSKAPGSADSKATKTPGSEGRTAGGYFDREVSRTVRIGGGDKRRSWLGFPTPNLPVSDDEVADGVDAPLERPQRSRCC